MNLLLLLLIITAIIIGMHLYNKYFNYSVHDGINIEIAGQDALRLIKELMNVA